MLQVNTTEVKSKLSLFRSYFFEIAVVVLAFCVFRLSIAINKMQTDQTAYLQNNVEKLAKIVDDNTHVLTENKKINEQFLFIIQNRSIK